MIPHPQWDAVKNWANNNYEKDCSKAKELEHKRTRLSRLQEEIATEELIILILAKDRITANYLL